MYLWISGIFFFIYSYYNYKCDKYRQTVGNNIPYNQSYSKLN